MYSVVVRVRKDGIKKDFYFANTGEAANFENHLLELDKDFSTELLFRDIDSAKLSKDPRLSAINACSYFFGGELEN